MKTDMRTDLSPESSAKDNRETRSRIRPIEFQAAPAAADPSPLAVEAAKHLYCEWLMRKYLAEAA
jgi:hypothetical protein